ncbi:MAG: YbhB/YbcL family Raf kinase inhibitor-like protein [Arcobacteraceae bacterium]|nr:YbhB/YbcL family Raf kinase inhibitor-like protein [Arcobacteraceae bacterium]
MKKIEQIYIKLIAIGLITMMVTGCGGGGGSSDSSSSSSSSAINGNVAKAPIDNATVTIYRVDTNEVLGTTKTDAKGDYSLDIGNYTGAVRIVASGGTYTDEVSGVEQNSSTLKLEAISSITVADRTVNVTPVTDISAQRLLNMETNVSKLANKINIIENVNKNIARVLTGSDFNPTKVRAKILDRTGKEKIKVSDGDEGKYGTLLAIFAKLSDSNASKVRAQIDAIYDDIKDGVADELSEDMQNALNNTDIQKGINSIVINDLKAVAIRQQSYDVNATLSGITNIRNQKRGGKTEFFVTVNNIDTKIPIILKNEFATFEVKDKNGNDTLCVSSGSTIKVTLKNSEDFNNTRSAVLNIGSNKFLLTSKTNQQTASTLKSEDIFVNRQTNRYDLNRYFKDPDGDQLTYSYDGKLPEGISLDEDGVFRGTPTLKESKFFKIKINAKDSHGNTIKKSFRLNVLSRPRVDSITVATSTKVKGGITVAAKLKFNKDINITTAGTMTIVFANNAGKSTFNLPLGVILKDKGIDIDIITGIGNNIQVQASSIVTDAIIKQKGLEDRNFNFITAAGQTVENLIVDNIAPAWLSNTSATIDENAAISTVVYQSNVSDSDSNITYSINDANFSIDTKTGKLTLAALLDYETKQSYSLNIEAKDTAGNIATQTIDIQVNNIVDNKPVLAKPTQATISEDISQDITIATIKTNGANSDEKTIKSFSIKNSAGNFIIDNNGAVKIALNSHINYSVNDDHKYTLQIYATNDKGDSDEVKLTILVTNTPEIEALDDLKTMKNTDSSIIISVLSNDKKGVDNQDLTIKSVTTPTNGTATIINNNTEIKYENNTTDTGNISFSYTITNGEDNSIAGVNISIIDAAAKPDAPTIDTISGDDMINLAESSKDLNITGTAPADTNITLTYSGKKHVVQVGSDGKWIVTYSADELPGDGHSNIFVYTTNVFGNQSATITKNIKVDKLSPVLTITDNKSGVLNQTDNVVTFKFTFSDLVDGFKSDSISVTNGKKSIFKQIATDKKWTLDVIADGTSTKDIIVSINNSDIKDKSGNRLEGDLTNPLTKSQEVDTKAPTLNVTTPIMKDGVISKSEQTNVTIEGKSSDAKTISLTIGDIKANATVNADGSWKATNIDISSLSSSAVVLVVTATDENNNITTLTLNDKILKDTSSPTISGLVKPQADLIGGSEFEISFKFNMLVTLMKNTNNIKNNFILKNVDLISYIFNSSTKIYTFTFKPRKNKQGNLSISLKANVVKSISGNGNKVQELFKRAFNSRPPTINITSHTNNQYINNTEALNLELNGTVSSDANNQNVIIKSGDSIIGTALAANGTWSKSGIDLRNKYYRYVRFYGDGSNKNAGTHIVEIEVYDTNNVNVARGKAVQGYTVIDNQPFSISNSSEITDGERGTFGYAGMSGYKYVLLDLGSLHELKSIKVWRYYYDGRRYNKTHIKVSNDNINWVSLYDGSTPYVETDSGKEFTTIPDTIIQGNTTLTANVKNELGTENSITLNLNIKENPQIVSVNIDNDTLISGATTQVTVNFNNSVDTTTFTSEDINATNTTVDDLIWSNNNKTLTVTLTPMQDVEDITNTIEIGVNWKDINGFDGSGYTSTNYKVITKYTEVNSVSFASHLALIEPYHIGENLKIRVIFSKAVEVTGTPYLNINLDGTVKKAKYISGSGTKVLYFEYMIKNGDSAQNGISINANIKLDSNSMIKDKATLLNTNNAFEAIGANANHKVDTTKAGIDSITIISTPTASSTYTKAENITLAVKFTQSVIVTNTPTLKLVIGEDIVEALYKDGNNSDTINFVYTVEDNSLDLDGISIPKDTISLGTNANITNSNQTVFLSNAEISNIADQKVNSFAPYIKDINLTTTISGLNNTAIIGDTLKAVLTFNSSIILNGDISLKAKLGSKDIIMTYSQSLSDNNSLVFIYIIQENDSSNSGFDLLTNSLFLESGTTLKSTINGKDVTLEHFNKSNNTKIDGIRPTLVINAPQKVNKDFSITVTSSKDLDSVDESKIEVPGVSTLSDSKITGLKSATLDISTLNASDGEIKVTLKEGTFTDRSGLTNKEQNVTIIFDKTTTLNITNPIVDKIYTLKEMQNMNISGTTDAEAGQKVKVNGIFDVKVQADGTWSKKVNLLERSNIALKSNGLVKISSSPGLIWPDDKSMDDLIDGKKSKSDLFKINNALDKSLFFKFDDKYKRAIFDIWHKDAGDATAFWTTLNGSLIIFKNGGKVVKQLTFKGKEEYYKGVSYKSYWIGANIVFDEVVIVFKKSTPWFGEVEISAIPVEKAYISATIKDTLGNEARKDQIVKMDIVAPTLNIELNKTKILANQKLKATINFNEAVKDFDIDDINTTNGTLSDFIDISDTEKSVIFTPNSEIKVDAVKIIVGQNFTDLFNNHPSSDTNSASFNIDTIRGKINNIFMIPHIDGSIPFVKNEEINVRVVFDQDVIVDKTPNIIIALHKLDGTIVEKMATFKDGNNSKVLNFIYKIQEGDIYKKGISIPQGSISLNGGYIKLISSNEANINYSEVVLNNNIIIDSSLTSITSIDISSNPGNDQTYTTDDEIIFKVKFTDLINIIDTNNIKLKFILDGVIKEAIYKNGDGSDTIFFTYTVGLNDRDTNGISIPVNAITTSSFSGSTVSISEAVADNLAHKVSTAKSVIKDIYFKINPSIYYKTQDTITAILEFNENITVALGTKKPTIDLKLGDKVVKALYDKTRDDKLYFNYIVQDTDTENSGVSILKNSLVLNGATLNNMIGLEVIQEFNTLFKDKNILVDTTAPTLDIAAPNNINDNFNITIKTNEPISISNKSKFSINRGIILNISLSQDKKTITVQIDAPNSYDGDIEFKIQPEAILDRARNTNLLIEKVISFSTNKPTISIKTPANNTKQLVNDGVLITGVSDIEDGQKITAKVDDMIVGEFEVKNGKFNATIPRAYFSKKYRYVRAYFNRSSGVINLTEFLVLDPQGKKLEVNKMVKLFKKVNSTYIDTDSLGDNYSPTGVINGIRGTDITYGKGMEPLPAGKYYLDLDLFNEYLISSVSLDTGWIEARNIILQVSNDKITWDTIKDYRGHGSNIRNHDWLNPFIEDNTKVKFYATNKYGTSSSEVSRNLIPSIKATAKISLDKTVVKFGEDINISITLSPNTDLNSFGKDDIIAPNGTLGTLETDPNNDYKKYISFTPNININDTTNVITLKNSWTNKAGFNASQATSKNYKVATKSMMINITDDKDKVTNKEIKYTFKLTSPSSTFDIGDIQVSSNAIKSNFSGSGDSYSLTVTPPEDFEGDLTLVIEADTVSDTNGIGNLYLEYIQKVNTKPIPKPTINPIAALLSLNDDINITGSGKIGAAILVEFNGIKKSTTVLNDGTWSLTLGVNSYFEDDTYDVKVIMSDEVGNSNFETTTLKIDTSKDKSAQLFIDSNIMADNIINQFEQYSIRVSGKTKYISDGATLTLQIGTITKSTTVTNNIWSVDNIDISSLADGNISIAARVGTLTKSQNIFKDTSSIVPIFSTPKSIVKNDFDISLEFTKDIGGLDLLDFEIKNATILSLTKVNNKKYILTIDTKGIGTKTKTVSVSIKANSVGTKIGNKNLSSHIDVIVDKTAPTLKFTSHSKNQYIVRLLNLTIAGTSDEIGAKVALKYENKNLGTSIVQNDGSWKKENIDLGITAPRKITNTWTNLLRVDGIANNSNFVRASGGNSAFLANGNKSERIISHNKVYRYDFKDIYSNGHFNLYIRPQNKSYSAGIEVRFYLFDKEVYRSGISTSWLASFNKWPNSAIKFNRVDLRLSSLTFVPEFEVFGKSVDKINLSANVKDKVGNEITKSLNLTLKTEPKITNINISDTTINKDDNATVVVTFDNKVNTSSFTAEDITTPNATLSDFIWSNSNKTLTATLTPNIDTKDLTNNMVVGKDWKNQNGVFTKSNFTSPNYKIDTIIPIFQNIAITSDAGIDKMYQLGDEIIITALFDENIISTDAKIKINIGGEIKELNINSSNSNKLIFNYIVQNGDNDTNGISVVANSLSGDIKDTFNNSVSALDLAFVILYDNVNHKVDTAQPKITSISFTSTPNSDNTYSEDENIILALNTSASVVVIGTPELSIKIGEEIVKASYVNSSSDKKTLNFSYTVISGDYDEDGIQAVSNTNLLIGVNVANINKNIVETYTGTAASLTSSGYADIRHIFDGDTTYNSSHTTDFGTGVGKSFTTIFKEATLLDHMRVYGGNSSGNRHYTKNVKWDFYDANDRIVKTITKTSYDKDWYYDLNLNGLSIKKIIATKLINGYFSITELEIYRSKPNALSLNGGAILDENNKELLLNYSGINSTSNVDAKSLSAVITAPSAVNGDFDITATLNKDVNLTTTSGIAVTNGSVSSVSSANNRDYNIKISPTPNFQGDLSITIGDTTEIVVVDHTAPTLNITSPISNQVITRNEAANLTLSGTSDANGQNVTIKMRDSILGTALVADGTWNKSGIALKDKYYRYVRFYGDGSNMNAGTHLVEIEVYDTKNVNVAKGKAVKGYTVSDNTSISIKNSSRITDGVKGMDYYADIGGGYKYVLLDLGSLHELKSIKVWRYFDGRKYNKTHIKVSNDNINWVSLYDGSTPYGEWSTGGKFPNIPYTMIQGNTTLTVNVKDEAGNEIIKDIDLTVVDNLKITDINITDTTLSAGETANVIFSFNREINTSTFTVEDLTTPNATINNFVWSDSNKTLTTTLTPINNIQYDNTNKIAVGQNWEDILGKNGSGYTSVNYKVDTKSPVLQNIAITSDAGIDKMYQLGDEIIITALFDENIILTDAKIKINIGGVEKELDINSSNSNKLIFNYIVQDGDNDANGISVVANTLSGDIKDNLNNSAELSFSAIYDDINHKVDTIQQPKITSISFTSTPNSGNTYSENENITIDINISVPVVVLGIPTLDLQIGSTIKKTTYSSISDDKKILTFVYTVVGGDYDEDGIQAVANALSLNGGIILDENNKELLLNYSGLNSISNVDARSLSVTIPAPSVVDTTPPTLAITSHTNNQMIDRNEAANLTLSGTSEAGAKVDLSVGTNSLGTTTVQSDGTWSKSGIALKDKYYRYVRFYGDGSNMNAGTHIVEIEIYDTNNTNVARGKTVQGYTVIDDQPFSISDSSRITDGSKKYKSSYAEMGGGYKYVLLDLGSLHELKSIKVWRYYDGRRYNKTHIKVSNDNINWVSLYDGSTPYGETDSGKEFKTIPYTTIQGNTTLTATAKDEAGNEIIKDIDLTVIDNLKITDINIIDTTLSAGETANVIFSFNREINTSTFTTEDITTPNATLGNFIWSDDNKTLTTILTPINNIQYDNTNKIAVGQNWEDILGKNGSGYTSVNYEVDTKLPSLQNIAITSNVGTDNIYQFGDEIIITALFNENVTVLKDTNISIKVGNTIRIATLKDVAGKVVRFSYIVQDNDNDINGISVVANSIKGAIEDILGNKPSEDDLSFSAINNAVSHQVSTTIAGIKSLNITSTPSSGGVYYGIGNDINITVEFSKNITVANVDINNKPYIIINVGGIGKYAYLNSSNGSNIIFTYKVQEGDLDNDGISVPKSDITLNTTTVKSDGVSANITYYDTELNDDSSHKVDGVKPTFIITQYPTVVNGKFNITVKANELIQNLDSNYISADNDVKMTGHVSDDDNQLFTISFEIGANTKDGNIVIFLASNVIEDQAGNKNDNPVSVTIQYDITPPTLEFTSHTNNQMIISNEAKNLTLSGTTTAEDGQNVNLSVGNNSLGTATIIGSNWKKQNINFFSFLKGSKLTYSDVIVTGASITTDVWRGIKLFDGEKEDKTGFATNSNPKEFKLTINTPKRLHTVKIYKGTDAHTSNSYLNSTLRMYSDAARTNEIDISSLATTQLVANGLGLKITTKDSFTLDMTGIYSEVASIYIKDSDTKYLVLSEIEIYGFDDTISLTANVKDKAGNETTKDINLTVVNGFTLLSDSVENNATLDSKYAFDNSGGQVVEWLNRTNTSPHLNWGAAPSGTVSYAIIMDDISAGQGNGWIHWNVFNIPAATTSLDEGWSAGYLNADGDINQRTAQGNGVPADQYVGPWPPAEHTYQIKIYALDSEMPILDGGDTSVNTTTFETQYGANGTNNILGETTLIFRFTP